MVAAIGLVPWVKNHKYLRDFYDYGLFINVNARFDQGQRLFVDFTTPAQSATFALNHLAERLGGGSYVGMTWGAAALIVLMAVVLTLVLARRWPAVLAAVFVAAIVVCSGSQHTIVFYNPIGVFAMALVVWSFAVAPLLRREQAGWHALAAIGLVLGGLNKINFHLLSCAMALGWIVWGAIAARASWRQVAAGVGFVFGFGIVVPLALELAWTGADLRTWYYNVIQLPLSARGDRVGMLGEAKLYFSTLHNYYGALRLPQSSLVVLVLPLLALPFTLRVPWGDQGWRRPVFALLAGVCGALSAAALLLTNNEIVYLSVAASLVMLAGLWLGFGLPGRGWAPWAGLALPAVLVGFCGWESAWLGQRSQFGHASDPRASFVRGETIGPDFGYLRGLQLPPGFAGTMGELAAYRYTLGAESSQVFYGPGCEWLERIWPAPKVPKLPVIAAAFENERELGRLQREVIDGGPFRHIFVVEAWSSWPLSVQEAFLKRFMMERVGGNILVYHKLRPGVLWARPLAFHENIGGNVDSMRLISDLAVQRLADGRRFVGTDRGSGTLEIDAPSYRVSAEAVLRRTASGRSAGPVTFAAYATSGTTRFLRWSRELSLPDGVDELIVPTGQLDASGLGLTLSVTVPEREAGAVIAGWRDPRLWNTVGGEKHPPLIQEGATRVDPAPPVIRDAILPAVLADAELFTRNVASLNGECLLAPRGELWIRVPAILSKIEFIVRAVDNAPESVPQLRVIFYKGGRLEFFHPTFDASHKVAHYTAWSSESSGWLALIADPHKDCPPFVVKIGAVERH